MTHVEIDQIKFHADEKLKVARSIERLVQTAEFCKAFELSPPDQRLIALEFVQKVDIVALKNWMVEQQCERAGYMDMSVRQLRTLGRQRRIMDYQYLTKLELVDALEEDDERRKNTKLLGRGS